MLFRALVAETSVNPVNAAVISGNGSVSKPFCLCIFFKRMGVVILYEIFLVPLSSKIKVKFNFILFIITTTVASRCLIL